jgi:mono/diheme cytochrome c family protein/cytochrome c556
MKHVIPVRSVALRYAVGVAVYICVLVGVSSLTGHARQAGTLAGGAYSSAQAKRGQDLYVKQCVACHGEDLSGAIGPPLAGDAFVSIWAGRSVAELVDKVQNTMPLGAGGTLTRPQSTDIVAYILQVGKYPAGQAELSDAALPKVSFPAARTAPAAAAAGNAGNGGGPAFGVAGNLAQIMRGITFPNANIIFNVQIKDPGNQPKVAPGAMPFDYVNWGATVYPGWQAVDQAALALIESTPLFMLPGRRCENGRPAPIDRADYKQMTDALVLVAREAYKASQTRNQDTVIAVAEKLNDACANCHKVYRDSTQEGLSSGAKRCL